MKKKTALMAYYKRVCPDCQGFITRKEIKNDLRGIADNDVSFENILVELGIDRLSKWIDNDNPR